MVANYSLRRCSPVFLRADCGSVGWVRQSQADGFETNGQIDLVAHQHLDVGEDEVAGELGMARDQRDGNLVCALLRL